MSLCTRVANGQTRPTGSGHADAQVCAGTASLSCWLISHSADSRAVWLCHPAPRSFTGLVESANLSRVQTRCVCLSWVSYPRSWSPTFVPRTRGYRPRRWRMPCAQTACSARNNARITSRCNARSHALSAVDETV
ncbi:hypothetical protein KTR9_5451 (plasmid) [Gordonia sp. KTR9]|nr:hypothetical protein KTR9_5451 [Gordonia sp. KTR9]